MKNVVEIKDKSLIEKLFEGWEETLIWSCLQDCMGKAYADSSANPVSAQIIIGDFCFLAGEPSDALILGYHFDKPYTAYEVCYSKE